MAAYATGENQMMVYASEAGVKMLTCTTMTLTMTVITRADAVYCAGASALASHAVVFRRLVLHLLCSCRTRSLQTISEA